MNAAVRWQVFNDRPFQFHSIKTGSVAVTRKNADRIGTMLWHANFAHAEWDADPSTAPEYVYAELAGEPQALTVLGAISCYGYHTWTDEPEVWLLTDASQFTAFLQAEAISRLSGATAVACPIIDPEVFLKA